MQLFSMPTLIAAWASIWLSYWTPAWRTSKFHKLSLFPTPCLNFLAMLLFSNSVVHDQWAPFHPSTCTLYWKLCRFFWRGFVIAIQAARVFKRRENLGRSGELNCHRDERNTIFPGVNRCNLDVCCCLDHVHRLPRIWRRRIHFLACHHVFFLGRNLCRALSVCYWEAKRKDQRKQEACHLCLRHINK